MFHFGSYEDSASLYFTKAVNSAGPKVSESSFEKMSEEELKVLIAYRRIAYLDAIHDGAPEEVSSTLLKAYDEVFTRLAEVSERFRKIVETGLHKPITGFRAESVNKYRMLAGHKPLEDIL